MLGFLALSWIIVIPKIRKYSTKRIVPIVWIGVAVLLRSNIAILFFAAAWVIDIYSNILYGKDGAKKKPVFSATEVVVGLGFIGVLASLGEQYMNVSLSTLLLFVSFLLKLNYSPVRMAEYPERSIDSYLLARRSVQLACSLLGEYFIIGGAPLILVDIIAYVLLFNWEFDKKLSARKKTIYPDEKDMLSEASITTRLIISGPSSVGKDAIIKELLDRIPNAKLSISATNRKPRPSEVDAVDYFFKTTTEFEEMISNGELIEYTKYNGFYYGTPMQRVEVPGEIVIYNVEPDGHNALKAYYPDAVSIFIAAPGESVEKRMRKRDKTATEEEIRARMGTAADILRRSADYDFFVMNDYSVGDTASQIEKILAILNLRVCTQSQTIKDVTQSFIKYE